MSDIIQLLPDSIANQIAAGEVVQRPASVVKELLENAIDAGARHITVIVKDGGKALIQVVDDGCGMSETDARLSFERHATSKIRQAEDLFALRTMGFRGEALASIAAVAQVEMHTRLHDKEVGTFIRVEGSEVKRQEPVACAAGTAISVKNLFYNIPARRNFLKSTAVEMRHITDEFTRVALANPQVAFKLYQNDLETFNLPSGKLSQRIVGLFGKGYREQMVKCSEETDLISITGFAGRPDAAKKTRGEQFFFVNNRFIKSPYLHHAVLNAYEGLLAPDTHPFYVLFIEIDPARVDVNVHPTKTEVKFEDERAVYSVVRAAVRQALATHNIMPALDFELDVNFGSFKQAAAPATTEERAYTSFRESDKKRQSQNWETLFEGHEIRQSKINYDDGPAMPAGRQQRAITLPDSDQFFQVGGRYLAAPVMGGLLLIDQVRAHQRILYERFVAQLAHRQGNAQQCMFPVKVQLSPADHALVNDLREEIQALGFLFDDFGGHSLVITATPAGLPPCNEKELFEGLLEQFKHNKDELSLSEPDNLARAMAVRSAVRENQPLTSEEAHRLATDLFACEMPNYAPDGSKTFFILDLKQINHYFS